MQEIKCPQCGKVFKVDESGFSDIVKQVRDKEFDKEIKEREALFKADLETHLKAAEASKKLAVAEAVSELEKMLSKKDVELASLKAQLEAEIEKLRTEAENDETKRQLAVTEAVSRVERECDTLKMELKSKDTERKLMETSLRERYEEKLKVKEEEIAYYKDFKARQSTKMIGESLELHCENEFNRLRATGFQNAYFEKDNDIRTGSKGDYIYRESDEDGNEIISIMFEMKNEQDETATKKKNEDFLKELHKDREEKACEYAVLVSLLEPDSELYNTGIVDKSHRYPKM